ncbi:guanine nucleotide binding protein, alpha subunit [Cyathus striatus]|nr:guanine nucleotide binding protein, alpha subunit [Cyathus striatus]
MKPRQQLSENKRKPRGHECKILLLGTSESGKSTIIKQMKILCNGGFTQEELMQYRVIVYQNLIVSAQQVIAEVKKRGLEYESPHNQVSLHNSVFFSLNCQGLAFNGEIAEAINVLWKDPAIKKVMCGYSEEFYVTDNAKHFFTHVMRIGQPEYVPDRKDVLMAWQKTYGVIEERFMTKRPPQVHMFDVSIGHEQLKRKKWIYCLENITHIIFCASLSEYDQNRMNESLTLFESIVNSRWFLRTSFILILNKVDVFKLKIKKVPLEHHFHDYTGGCDIKKAVKYILWTFMQLNRGKLSVYPHLIECTSTSDIWFVFLALNEIILQNLLKDSGVGIELL